MIEAKVLSMLVSARAKYPPGVTLNLCSVDCDNVMSLSWNALHELYSSPLTIAICLAWLYMILGPSALVGCTVMVLSVIISAGFLAAVKSQLQSALMKLSDARMS